MRSFDYREQESRIFGKVLRPLVDLDAYSRRKKKWFRLENVLADTGADVSILPKEIGEALLEDITEGRVEQIRGIVPHAKLIVYIHQLKFRVDSREFELPVAIADSSETPPILGRVKGLDLFDVSFNRGKSVKIEI